jgi:hypothetical protein
MNRHGTANDPGRASADDLGADDPGADDLGADDLGIRASALRVLDYVLRLELTQARWERVDGILQGAAEAASAGDLGALRTATNELRAVGPVRVIRIGGTPVGPPPLKVRERAELMRGAVAAAHGTGELDEEGDDDER